MMLSFLPHNYLDREASQIILYKQYNYSQADNLLSVTWLEGAKLLEYKWSESKEKPKSRVNLMF